MLAVRMALGATRGRIVRQLLTESVLLAAIGGVAGVLLGVWAIDGLLSLAPESMPRLNEVRLEPGVLAFASLVTLVTGVIFGLGPAIQSARAGVTQSLKEGARRLHGHRRPSAPPRAHRRRSRDGAHSADRRALPHEASSSCRVWISGSNPTTSSWAS